MTFSNARNSAQRLGAVLREGGLTMASAESCTGGMVGMLMTDVPGSSVYYIGGVVAYANEAKSLLLCVDPIAIEEHGAVSEVVARQMADGVRDRLDADVTVSLTGIAGPGGGGPDKPVGLVFIGLSHGTKTLVTRHVFDGDRKAVRIAAATAALDWAIDSVEGP